MAGGWGFFSVCPRPPAPTTRLVSPPWALRSVRWRRLQACETPPAGFRQKQKHHHHEAGSESAEEGDRGAERQGLADKPDQGWEERADRPAGIVTEALRGPAHLCRVEFSHERPHWREFHQEYCEKRDTDEQECAVVHRYKHVDEDHRERADRRQHKGPFAADGIAHIRTQQKAEQRAQDLDQKKRSGAGRR